MTHVDDILALVDAGLGTIPSQASTPINVEQCERRTCKAPPEPGHSYCRLCLAWLRCESDEDPLEGRAAF